MLVWQAGEAVEAQRTQGPGVTPSAREARGRDGPASPTGPISNGGGDDSVLRWLCGMQSARLIRRSSPAPSC